MGNLGLAFSFPFRDPDWVKKSLLGGLFAMLSLFGVGVIFLAGYCVQVTQRVMRREPQLLPEWDNLGQMFILGLKYCVVYVVYLLPIVLLMVPVIPLGIVAETASGPGEIFGVVGLIYLFGLTIVAMLYGIAFTLAIPIISYKFAERERILDALDIADVVQQFGRNWQNTLVVVLISIGVQYFAWIGIVVFLVGVLLTIFYAYLVSSYLSGALYLDTQQKASP